MRDALPARIAHDHVGLAYGAWAPVGDGGKIDDEMRGKWLFTLGERIVSPDYARAFDRWKSSFRPPGDRTFELALKSRLLVGHGNPSATDVGLTVHHTWGVPLIPGSALKGLLAHYVDAVYGPEDPDRPSWEQPEGERERALYQGVTWNDRRIRRGPGEIYRALFGAPDADEDRELRERGFAAGAQRGLVVFHDALYVPGGEEADRPFAADVLTVHQKAYYNSEGKCPPNDYDAPNPVSFLSVRPGARMLLALSGPPDWTALAKRLLLDALEQWGVGGKTSSGYGRMVGFGEGGAGSGAVRASGEASAAREDASRAASQGGGRPRRRGDRISVTCVEGPGGKVKFRTDEGMTGHFAPGESPPSIGVGESLDAWIANVGHGSYTLTLREDLAAKHATHATSAAGPDRAGRPASGRPWKGRRQ